MDVLISVFLVLHFVGIVVLLGGYLTQVKAMNQGTARFSPLMLRGALAMLGTGVLWSPSTKRTTSPSTASNSL